MIDNTHRNPFYHTDVSQIAREEFETGGVSGLKDRVRDKVLEELGITSGKIPERVRAWIHQICLPYTAGTPLRRFTGKLAEPIDRISLAKN